MVDILTFTSFENISQMSDLDQSLPNSTLFEGTDTTQSWNLGPSTLKRCCTS